MKNLIFFSVLALLQSCSSGSGGSTGTASPGGGSTTSPIPETSSVYSKMTDGIYLRLVDNCITSNNQYFKTQYIKVNNEFIEQRKYFQTNQCDPAQELGVTSLVVVFASAKIINGVDGEITTLSTVDGQLLTLDSSVIAQYNQIQAYGYSNWDATTAKSILDKPLQPGQTPSIVSGALVDYVFKSVSTNNTLTFFINGVQLLKQ